jgi:hypothetical protein
LTFNKVICEIIKNHQGCGDNPSGDRILTLQHQPVKYSHTIVINQYIAGINLVNQAEIL